MDLPSDRQALRQVAERLAELIEADPAGVRQAPMRGATAADGLLKAGPFSFAVYWQRSGAAAPVAAAVEQIREHAESHREEAIPLLAVPFMREAGRKRCAGAGVAWIDLSGNARIVAPGLRILVEGQPDRYKRRGRPSSAFAPRSSRIARWLLMHPSEPLTQREIAGATGVDEGYTSRIVGRLEDDGLIVRGDGGTISAKDSDLLLDAWNEAYDFSKHRVIRGHVAARTGDALLRQLVGALQDASLSHAATGLAAAWVLDRFAGFRTATLYLAEEPTPGLIEALSFREEDRGANVWLVVPNDEGVFQGATLREGTRCVHPVQAYLDLQAHPERAEEAAQQLRARHLSWGAGA